MKLMIASDIHGSITWAEKMMEVYRAEKAEKLILLGDLLYHGPRNDLPDGYRPKEVIALLNSVKEELLCVRGNCEAEVDQMVLEFPVLADYMLLWPDRHTVFATHGHVWNTSNLPPLQKGDVLLHGHTHVPAAEECGGIVYLNPGSVSIPKNGMPHSYMIYENDTFAVRDFDGNVYLSYCLK